MSGAGREQTAEVPREAAGDGRITLAELDERLTLAYAAKTCADPGALTGDLPGPEVTGQVAVRPGAATGPLGGTARLSFPVAVMGGVGVPRRPGEPSAGRSLPDQEERGIEGKRHGG